MHRSLKMGLAFVSLLASAACVSVAAPSIKLVPGDGMNLEITRQVTPTTLDLKPAPRCHNWFAGSIDQLPLGEYVELRIMMAGCGAAGHIANTQRWVGLRPVLTYADPGTYEAYTWYRKDAQGRWYAGDPLQAGEAGAAGTGAVPVQRVVPAGLAAECLSPDGSYWCPWREAEDAVSVPGIDGFKIPLVAAQPRVTIAMRVPYPYVYQEAFLNRLTAAKLPGVSVDTLGDTAGGRKLHIVRVEDPAPSVAAEARKTVVVYAREHPNEPAGSWAAHGLLARLLAGTPESAPLRANTTWLLIPIFDPDGAADSAFERVGAGFRPQWDRVAPEIRAYGDYLQAYVKGGRTLDLVVSLHNAECNEAGNLTCPYLQEMDVTARLPYERCNDAVFGALTKKGFSANAYGPWMGYGRAPVRLFTWAAAQFGSLETAYEVNDRYPGGRLNLAKLQELGGEIGAGIAVWLACPDGAAQHTAALAKVAALAPKTP